MVQMDCETDSNVDETNGASDKEACGFSSGFGGLGSLAMTSSLCRLFILIERCPLSNSFQSSGSKSNLK